MTPTNTTERIKKDPTLAIAEMMCVGTSNMIELQEAQGQRELVRSEVLPTQGLHDLRDILERAGGSVGSPVDGDPMFTHVTMPSGWSKKATDHSMWSSLVDQAGRERASIFYKAAFYDRGAFIRLNQRFVVDAYSHKVEHEVKAVLRDAKGEVQRETQIVSVQCDREAYETRQKLAKEIEGWLDANYPDWTNPAAYWE